MSIYFQEIKDDGYGVCVIQQKDGGLWGVSDYEYNIIVPFGKYDWIDRFDNALARVNVCSKESLIFDEENGEKDELIISVKKVRFKDINPEWFATTFNIQELYDSTNFPREKKIIIMRRN